MSNEDIIRKVYYDPNTGFSGIEKTYQTLKKMGSNIKREEIKKFLEKQEVVQINKKNYGKPGSFVPPYPLFEFQIDLIYLENKHLNKASYGLVCIDTFSKKGDVELLKRKSAPQVTEAMGKILNRMGIPKSVYCDEGSEFNNAEFKKLMNDNKIELIFTLRHAPMVERLNRTLKELLNKYLQSTDTKTITNVLPKILRNYNSSYHKTIRMAPNEVNEKNKGEVYQNILEHASRKKYEELKVGDSVRVQLKRKSLDKGYKPRYSKQIYEIEKIDSVGDSQTNTKYYHVKGLGRKYLRAFLQKVGEIEKNPEPADLEGTREGHLKKLAKLPISESSIEEKARLEAERESQPIAKTKPVRITKNQKRLNEEKKLGGAQKGIEELVPELSKLLQRI
jgi:hypothetical protein